MAPTPEEGMWAAVALWTRNDVTLRKPEDDVLPHSDFIHHPGPWPIMPGENCFFVATKATKKKKNVILCEFASIYA